MLTTPVIGLATSTLRAGSTVSVRLG